MRRFLKFLFGIDPLPDEDPFEKAFREAEIENKLVDLKRTVAAIDDKGREMVQHSQEGRVRLREAVDQAIRVRHEAGSR